MTREESLDGTPLFVIANWENRLLGYGCPESGMHSQTLVYGSFASAKKYLGGRSDEIRESCAIFGPFRDIETLKNRFGLQCLHYFHLWGG